jgi:hypothetical protein
MLSLHELPYKAGLSGFEKTEDPTMFIFTNNDCIEPPLFMNLSNEHLWIFVYHHLFFLTNINNPVAKI